MRRIDNKAVEDYIWLKLADAYAGFFIHEILDWDDTEFKQIFYDCDEENAMAMRDLTVTTALAAYELTAPEEMPIRDWIEEFDDCIKDAWQTVVWAVEEFDKEHPHRFKDYQSYVLRGFVE